MTQPAYPPPPYQPHQKRTVWPWIAAAVLVIFAFCGVASYHDIAGAASH